MLRSRPRNPATLRRYSCAALTSSAVIVAGVASGAVNQHRLLVQTTSRKKRSAATRYSSGYARFAPFARHGPQSAFSRAVVLPSPTADHHEPRLIQKALPRSYLTPAAYPPAPPQLPDGLRDNMAFDGAQVGFDPPATGTFPRGMQEATQQLFIHTAAHATAGTGRTARTSAG